LPLERKDRVKRCYKPLYAMPRRNRTDMEFALDRPAQLRALPDPAQGYALPDDETDEGLLVRVAERDRFAFEALYKRYIRSVYGLALRRLRDRQRAEDAVQETFAAVWRSAGSYRPDRGPAAPWLYAIARNAIVDRLRARVEPVSEAPDLPSLEAGPADRAESSYVSWRVHRAMEELPEKEREVVELAYWSGLSQSEVADYLHIPLGTVKTRTRSALSRLADVLEGELQ
jgi:RNA polymerase sigma-70 factor, ECF subfamily